MTFDVHQLDVVVLVGSAVTILAILAVRLSSRAGLPSLLIYLAMGVVLGEAGPGQITFDNADVAQALGFAALAIILAEGGLTTSWRDFRPSMPIGLSLATVGIAVSVSVMLMSFLLRGRSTVQESSRSASSATDRGQWRVGRRC